MFRKVNQVNKENKDNFFNNNFFFSALSLEMYNIFKLL